MRRLVGVAAAVVALGLAGAVAALLLAPLPPSPPGPEPGRSLFHAHCATCHGADGRGASWRARLLFLRPGNLAAPGTARLPDEYLADIIRHGGSTFGKPGMPSFGFALSDAEIEALVAYLRALPARAPGYNASALRRGLVGRRRSTGMAGTDQPGGRTMAKAMPSITKKDISSLRSTLEYLREAGELLASDVEIDPHLELAAIQKRLDGGPPLLFERVKGYPNARLANNLYASADRIARLFGVDDPKKFKFKAVEAMRQPLPPIEVKDAPCQEVTITKDVDVWDRIPMISHSKSDPARTLGAGNTVVRGRFFWGGSHIGYNRMNFRGPDYSSFQISPGSHMDMVATHWYRKEPIPMTINIGVPPACTMMAGSGFTYMILPKGADELGVAGALQGFPVELVKARTVDAWAIANAEYVLEGYLDTTQKVWESPLAEKDGKQGVYPFHPEWAGYMGKAYRTYKFQATAITHRKDKPIYYGLIVHGMDDHYIDVSMREAAFLEVADRISPGFCVDTHIPMGLTDWGGVVFQVQKRRQRDEGIQRNILTAAMAISLGMRLAIAVDEDVDIYTPEDILWALATRMTPESVQTVCAGGFGQTFQPAERSSAGSRDWTQSNIRFSGGLAIDATVPFVYKDAFARARYEIGLVDLAKWFTPAEIERARASQHGYARWMAERGI